MFDVADPRAAPPSYGRRLRVTTAFFVEARPEIGDADYDALYRELEALEKIRSWRGDSPTRRRRAAIRLRLCGTIRR